jgi:hypothetical protein
VGVVLGGSNGFNYSFMEEYIIRSASSNQIGDVRTHR